MLNTINRWLNIFICTFPGVFIGKCLSDFLDYRARPEKYAILSMSWYSNLSGYALFTVIFMLIAIVVKLVIRKYLKNEKPENSLQG